MRRQGDGTTRLSALLPDAMATRLATYLEAYANPRRDERRSSPTTTHRQHCARLRRRRSGAPTAHDPVARPTRAGWARRSASCSSPSTRSGCRCTAATPRPWSSPSRSRRSWPSSARPTCWDQAPSRATRTPTRAPARRSPPAQARRLACNAHIIPAVLGGDSEVLDLGRAQRLFTAAQRRALLLRDRTCRAEGCDIPGTWAEAHHWVAWRPVATPTSTTACCSARTTTTGPTTRLPRRTDEQRRRAVQPADVGRQRLLDFRPSCVRRGVMGSPCTSDRGIHEQRSSRIQAASCGVCASSGCRGTSDVPCPARRAAFFLARRSGCRDLLTALSSVERVWLVLHRRASRRPGGDAPRIFVNSAVLAHEPRAVFQLRGPGERTTPRSELQSAREAEAHLGMGGQHHLAGRRPRPCRRDPIREASSCWTRSSAQR